MKGRAKRVTYVRLIVVYLKAKQKLFYDIGKLCKTFVRMVCVEFRFFETMISNIFKLSFADLPELRLTFCNSKTRKSWFLKIHNLTPIHLELFS